MAEVKTKEFETAKQFGAARMRGPRAERVHYDADRNQLVIGLTTGAEIRLSPEAIEGLQSAAPPDLAVVELEELGLGIRFPRLDADLYVPALLEGVFGSKAWMAAQLGAEGGRARSSAKTAASRENGKRGGRPRNMVASSDGTLEKQFQAAMFHIYERAKSEAGYDATVFLSMLHERGGLPTARYLVNTSKPSDGYTHLYERGRLDLTVEAMITEIEKWHVLFTPEELGKARRRLKAYGYKSRL